MPRFNHMELTLPPGKLGEHRQEIRTFFHEIFGFDALDVPIVGQNGLLLRTDAETSQFILVTEQDKSLHSPGYDHLGFLYDTREEVDVLLEGAIVSAAAHLEAQPIRTAMNAALALVEQDVAAHRNAHERA